MGDTPSRICGAGFPHFWTGLLVVPVGGGFLLLLLVALLVFRAALVCCRAGLLVVPVGGGPPASRPRSELRSARRLEARPGPAAAHGHRSQALLPPTSTAAWPCRRRQALRSLRRPPCRQ